MSDEFEDMLEDDGQIVKLEMHLRGLHTKVSSMADREVRYVGTVAMIEQALATSAGARESHRAYREHMIQTIKTLRLVSESMEARGNQLQQDLDERRKERGE